MAAKCCDSLALRSRFVHAGNLDWLKLPDWLNLINVDWFTGTWMKGSRLRRPQLLNKI